MHIQSYLVWIGPWLFFFSLAFRRDIWKQFEFYLRACDASLCLAEGSKGTKRKRKATMTFRKCRIGHKLLCKTRYHQSQGGKRETTAEIESVHRHTRQEPLARWVHWGELTHQASHGSCTSQLYFLHTWTVMLCHVERHPFMEQDGTAHPFKEYYFCGADHDIPWLRKMSHVEYQLGN